MYYYDLFGLLWKELYNHKIIDWDKFTEFAKKHGGKTLLEMAKLWDSISIQTIHRALKKLDLRAKKDIWI